MQNEHNLISFTNKMLTLLQRRIQKFIGAVLINPPHLPSPVIFPHLL